MGWVYVLLSICKPDFFFWYEWMSRLDRGDTYPLTEDQPRMHQRHRFEKQMILLLTSPWLGLEHLCLLYRNSISIVLLYVYRLSSHEYSYLQRNTSNKRYIKCLSPVQLINLYCVKSLSKFNLINFECILGFTNSEQAKFNLSVHCCLKVFTYEAF